MVDTVVNLIGDNFIIAVVLTIAVSAVGLIFLPLLFRTVLPSGPDSYVRQPNEDLIEEAKRKREEKLAA